MATDWSARPGRHSDPAHEFRVGLRNEAQRFRRRNLLNFWSSLRRPKIDRSSAPDEYLHGFAAHPLHGLHAQGLRSARQSARPPCLAAIRDALRASLASREVRAGHPHARRTPPGPRSATSRVDRALAVTGNTDSRDAGALTAGQRAAADARTGRAAAAPRSAFPIRHRGPVSGSARTGPGSPRTVPGSTRPETGASGTVPRPPRTIARTPTAVAGTT